MLRDDQGDIIADTEVDIRFTVYRTMFQQNELTDYRETQSAITNEFGLLNAVIGSGTPDIGTWNGINWFIFPGFTDSYLRVEIDFGNGWLELSDEKLRVVPFAEMAGQANSLANGAWSPEGNYDTDENNFLGTGNYAPLIFKSANTERLRMDENGQMTFSVSNEVPTVRVQNPDDDSFEANLEFSHTYSAQVGEIIYNPFGFGMITEDTPITLNNSEVDFTVNASGNSILQSADNDTEVHYIVRDGTDTDVADISSGFITLGFTNAANVCMDTNLIMARTMARAPNFTSMPRAVVWSSIVFREQHTNFM